MLLEDASVLQDVDAITELFESDAVLVIRGEHRGKDAILSFAAVPHYVAEPEQVVTTGDTALIIGRNATSVAHRSADRTWRYAICVMVGQDRWFDRCPEWPTRESLLEPVDQAGQSELA